MEAAVRPVAPALNDRCPIEHPAFPGNIGTLLRFSERLSFAAEVPLNESDLIRLMEAFEEIPGPPSAAHGLVLARIAELAIFCAGSYADGCEFQAAGDLLVNPRQIDIYIHGKIVPIRKKRHGRISSQLAWVIGNDDPLVWLSRNTRINMRKNAILPAVYDVLQTFDLLSDDYLKTIAHRMSRVADTIGFLSAWQIDNAAALQKKLAETSMKTQALLMENLCHFDLAVFHEIGQSLVGLSRGNTDCRFLRCHFLNGWPSVFLNETI